MSAFGKLKKKFSSKRANQNRSSEIEKMMKEDKVRQSKMLRILLLGPGDTGKTTIIKQMKKIHNLHDSNDAALMKDYIQKSCVEYMKTLCIQSKRLYDEFDEKTQINDAFEILRTDFVSLEIESNDNNNPLTVDIADKIKALWSDNGIKQTLELRHYYQIHENVSYFLDKIEEIANKDYIPTFDDYLRIRQRSTGFNQTQIIANITKFGQHIFQFTDVGGQRSERKKWMRFISEDINAVLYVVAISEYDMKLYEDNKTNRLHEAIELFRTIMIKGKFFTNKSVLLFFNKYDLFKKKIKKTPITVAFDDFPINEFDPYNEDDVIRFVASKFLSVFENNHIDLSGPLHILRTTALDTDHIEQVFGNITAELVKNNFKRLHFM